jgi:hypothetical protein
MVGSVLESILRAYFGAYSNAGWEEPSSASGSVLGSMSRCVLQNEPRGVLGSILGMFFGAS